MTPKTRHELFALLQAQTPKPVTELHYRTPFELLVAVVLSAQATDKEVNKATARLFPQACTPQAMLALGEEGLKAQVRTIGLYQAKSRHLIKTCQLLLERHGGEVPHEREALEALPGVGRKTANVILNTAFGEPVIAVDTHVFRVSNRTGLAPGKTPLEVERGLAKHVPPAYRQNAHHWLILHGRYVCTARKSKCPSCVIRGVCGYKNKTPANEES